MIIWFAMVIPLITVLVLAFGFRKRIVWWELVVPLVLSAILIAIFKYSVQTAQTRDIEYWGGYIEQGQYYEQWDERVSCQHPVYEDRTTTDSEGNSHTEQVLVGYEHPYDVDNHPPQWQLIDSNGQSFSVDEEDFDRLVRQFGNKRFVELNRNYHSIDGDEYITDWKGDDKSLEPVTTTHWYENKVQAASSIYKFEKVDPKQYHLFEYPKVQNHYDCPAILGYKGPDRLAAERKFDLLNAKLGQPKQVRIWVLVFMDQPLDAGMEQEAYWKGGNKNELVCTIGINKEKEIQWAYIFSWSEAESLKIETRDYLNEQKKLDLSTFADWLGPEIKEKFVRKRFRDFSYLTVEPPLWAVMTTYILTLLVNLGLSIWFVTNEYDSESGTYQRRSWRRGF